MDKLSLIPFLPRSQYDYIEDRILDVPEVYTIYRTGSLRSLLPDSCTKIATYHLKEMDAISEMFARRIGSAGGRALKILINETGHRTMINLEEFLGGAFVKLESEPKLTDGLFIMISIDQGDFGHYIGCHHVAGTFYIYDSMMAFDGDRADSCYTEKAKKTLRKIFSIRGKYPFIVDYAIDRATTDLLEFYSFEVTGGALIVENMYLSERDQSHQFMADSVIMGVDNHNQYCWMWMIAYLLSRSIGEEAYSWGAIQRKIWEADIIPVVFIKCLISAIAPLPWSRDQYFVENFNTVLSNAETYRATFDTSNNRFCVYECALGKSFLEASSSLDLVSGLKTVIDRIDQMKIRRVRYQQTRQALMQKADHLLSSKLKRFVGNPKKITPSNFEDEFNKFTNLLGGEFSPDQLRTV